MYIEGLEFWNLKKEYATREEMRSALHALMRRSESGRKLLNEERKNMKTGRVSVEEYYASKLREARKRFEGKFTPTCDVPFVRAIREYVTGNISPELRELSNNTSMLCASRGTQAGIGLMYPLESRSISVSGTNRVTITEDVFDLLGAIRNKLVLNKAGATFITGLQGDVSFASYSGSSVRWADETESSKDGKGDFLKKTLSPKRLTAYVDISKQMLMQENVQIEKYIINDFSKAIASALQAAILGNHEHSAIKPDGIFTGATLAITGDANYSKIVGLQTEVYDSALSYCYLTNNKGFAKLKSTLKVKDTSEGFIIDQFKDDPLNYCADYPIYRTDDIPDIDGENGIAFGDFSELVIGQWGDLDITIDPYTRATDATIRLVVNTWFDAIVRRDSAIAVGSFI